MLATCFCNIFSYLVYYKVFAVFITYLLYIYIFIYSNITKLISYQHNPCQLVSGIYLKRINLINKYELYDLQNIFA